MKKESYQKGLQCLQCKSKIFSDHVHDYKTCSCGECYVDGGFDYFRMGCQDIGKVKIVKRKIPKNRKKRVLYI